jgi:hypothetical protein
MEADTLAYRCNQFETFVLDMAATCCGVATVWGLGAVKLRIFKVIEGLAR